MRGASIDCAVVGAARGGHQAYAEALILRWASIHWAVYGAAFGGHQAYVEALILRGASLDDAVYGATCGGHRAYADALRRRKPELIKRREVIETMVSKDKLSFSAALLATDPDSKIACGIILYLAMRPNSKTLPLATYLIPDVWRIVLDYATPTNLSAQDRHQLGVHRGQTLLDMKSLFLKHDLLAYARSHKPAHKDRANSLARAIDSASSTDKLDVLLKEQCEIIQGRNPNGLFARILPHNRNINPIKDRFQEIIEEHTETITTGSCDCASAHCSCQDEASEKAFKKR